MSHGGNSKIIYLEISLPRVFSGHVINSVTRLGDLWDYGQLFKAFVNYLFAQISHILCQFL